METELHVLILGFDHAFVVASMMDDALDLIIPNVGWFDSKTVFDTVTRLANTLEKRLQINVAGLQESHMTVVNCDPCIALRQSKTMLIPSQRSCCPRGSASCLGKGKKFGTIRFTVPPGLLFTTVWLPDESWVRGRGLSEACLFIRKGSVHLLLLIL
jgi:hypothetical protein